MSILKPVVRTFVVADLTCYLCGAHAGSLERERDVLQPVFLYKPVGQRTAIAVQDASRLRCPRCGGALFADSVEIIDRRTEPVDWEEDGPRRGRPPKWLIEQRRRRQQHPAEPPAAA